MITVVNDAGKQLDFYTSQLIKTVEELKQKTRVRLESMHNDIESVLSTQTAFLKKELAFAKYILQKLMRANSESNNKSQQFTCLNLAANTTKRLEKSNKRLNCPNIRDILFQPHATCQILLKSLLSHKSLGEFCQIPLEENNGFDTYKLVKKIETSVDVKDANNVCYINESCVLQDKTILLADNYNKCLKRLPALATTVSDCLKLPGSPWSVTAINEKEAAVTLPDQKQVRVIAVHKKMKKSSTMKFDFACRGITYFNNELFISDDDNTVYVYTVVGKLLR